MVVDSLTLLLSSMSIVHGIGFFFLLNEVSEQIVKNSNTELVELNKSKDKLFSIIAHDLKFPLGTFNYMLENVEDYINKGDPKKVKDLVILIRDNSKNTYQLLENLLHWSRNQLNDISLQVEDFNISKLVSDSINLFTAALIKKNITIINNCDEKFIVTADKEMIQVVIRNIIKCN
jgi:K+-sensing histidine kinase KdpD